MIKRKKQLKQKQNEGADANVFEHFNDFHEALAPPRINKVLEQLFTMLKDSEIYDQSEQQLMQQVIKVVSVWQSRKVYPEEILTELKEKLTAIDEEAVKAHSSKKQEQN